MQALTNGAYMRAGVADDPRTFVGFVTVPELNRVKSESEGRPIIEPKAYLRIERAGERDVLMRLASEADKRQYRDAWEAYEQKREQAPAGTPLATLFPGFPEIVATLEYFRVKTVEQLAAMSDTAIQNVGLGGREWQKKADEFLKAAEGAQGYHALKKAQEESAATIAKLEAQVAALSGKLNEQESQNRGTAAPAPDAAIQTLQAQMAALMAKLDEPKRGPGRPRKSEGDE